MRVYTKKEDAISIVDYKQLWFPLIFTAFIALFTLCIARGLQQCNDLVAVFEFLYRWVIPIIIILMFLAVDIIFIYTFLRKPIELPAQLVSKHQELYNGKEITYMTFSAKLDDNTDFTFIQTLKELQDPMNLECKCYTEGDNTLITGQTYTLRIKANQMHSHLVSVTDCKAASSTNPKAKSQLIDTLKKRNTLGGVRDAMRSEPKKLGVILIRLFCIYVFFAGVFTLIWYPEYHREGIWEIVISIIICALTFIPPEKREELMNIIFRR